MPNATVGGCQNRLREWAEAIKIVALVTSELLACRADRLEFLPARVELRDGVACGLELRFEGCPVAAVFCVEIGCGKERLEPRNFVLGRENRPFHPFEFAFLFPLEFARPFAG
jgi:hypothetical protein